VVSNPHFGLIQFYVFYEQICFEPKMEFLFSLLPLASIDFMTEYYNILFSQLSFAWLLLSWSSVRIFPYTCILCL